MRFCRLLCLLLALLLCLPLVGCGAGAEGLTVRVLGVGQSDCVLLSLAGEHILIDTGTASQRDTVLATLSSLGVRELAYLIVTHPHEDHYGNARFVLETHTVKGLLLSPAESEDVGYLWMQDAARQQGVPMQTVADGMTFSLGGATVEVFCARPQAADPNDASLVLRVHYGACRMLFMGDAEQEAEAALLVAWGADTACDLLKVGHHGSDTACSAEFLTATAPALAAISCGKDNEDAFPHRAVLEGLDAVGAAVYRTDLLGTLCFYCDGERIVYDE